MHLQRGAVLLDADRYYTEWHCPACGLADRTAPMPPNASRFHTCPRLASLTAPLVRGAADCTVEAVDREDYVGGEHIQQADDGRAYMAVRTRHASGRLDCAVLAPAAIASIHL
jgi:hypothetical protein